MIETTDAFIGAMKRSKKKGKRALTPPDQTIQTQSQTPPPALPIADKDYKHDDRVLALVRLLARRAAEHDYSQLLLQRESFDQGPVQ